jgi:transcriptional regulator with XRE-family HTH domain
MHQKTFMIRQRIGENIREGRRRLKLTQNQFAETVELSVQFLSALENGMQFASMDTYCRIAEALAIPLCVLFAAEKLQHSYLDEQIRLLISGWEKSEKKALLNIIREIKTIIQTKY